MAHNHEIEWRASHAVVGAKIRSEVATANSDVGLIFSDNRATVVGPGEVPIVGFMGDALGSPVNRSVFRSARTNVSPRWSSEGADTNIGLDLDAKGTGAIRFRSHGATGTNLVVNAPTGTPTDYLTIQGTAGGGIANVGTAGASANIDIAINPKGSGKVRFGDFVAGSSAVTGYITIKDASGAERKLAVVG